MPKKINSLGGKADNLLRLSAQFRVPAFFVIGPDELLDGVLSRFDQLGAQRVAVRSSAMNEDGADAAWAGQLETKLNVSRENLLNAVKSCRLSASSVRATAYGTAHRKSVGGVAVIVQMMIDSRVSGVAFSNHPVTGEKQVVIEAVQGLGEQLVSGMVTPDTYIENGEWHIVGDTPILTSKEIIEVTALAKRVEAYVGYPVDIEWTYDGATLYLLQARPITTL